MPDGRFAPSPTGSLHVGNLRTALIGWLCARVDGGRHLLRVEDLDPVASRPELVESHLADLVLMGIDWDDEVLHQSTRGQAHDDALDILAGRVELYPCFCSRREIAEAAAAPHSDLPEGAYPGTCARLGRAARVERLGEGRPRAWRVRAEAAEVTFTDRLAGTLTGVVDDFVVRRRDGVVAYNVAVVVDDHHQGVSEVVRGDDLLVGTARHAWLCDVMGMERPAWVHVPLVVGADGQRLAKRHGAVTIDDLARHWSLDRSSTAAELAGLLMASLGLGAPRHDGDLNDVVVEFRSRGGVAAIPRDPWIFDHDRR